MSADPITAIANAVSNITEMIAKLLATKEVRHMKAALDAAERYIHVNEGFGENKEIEEEEKAKLLKKLRTRFFKYN